MKLHIIVIAYDRAIGLRGLIDSFLSQRDSRGNPVTNWQMTVVHDGPAPFDVKETLSLYENDKRIAWLETETRQGNWGHANRKASLQMISGDPGDFVLITNDDNYYVPMFMHLMLRAAEPRTGFIYCDFLHHNFEYDIVNTIPKVNHIDMGAYIVELKLAQEIGFTHDEPASDGIFAEEVNAACISRGLPVVHIRKVLFIHN